MTAPDLSTAITEAVSAHRVSAFSGADTACSCDRKWRTNEMHRVHLYAAFAAMLAPVIRETQAVALEGYFKSVERIDECIHGLVDPDDSWLDFREAHNEFANDYVPLSPLSEVTNAVYYAKYRAKKLREES